MTKNSLQPASMLDLIEKAAAQPEAGKVFIKHFDPKNKHLQVADYKGVNTLNTLNTSKTWGGTPYPAPEGVAQGVFALPTDAVGHAAIPHDETGKRRFFVAVHQLVAAIADAYGCDQCPGNERAELHQQATDSIEAIKCFVLLARQANLAIGMHPSWARWGVAVLDQSEIGRG